MKTALKLLLVFVEYTESNTVQLVKAINSVDSRRGLHPWTNIMSILNEKDGADSELLVYAMTLVNKVCLVLEEVVNRGGVHFSKTKVVNSITKCVFNTVRE